MKPRGMIAAAGVLALAASTAARPARFHADGYPRGAPPGMTGGFGEPTCVLCHFGGALNEPGGSLAIDGLPERYTPGETYRLIVRLRRGEMGAAGFQLSARTAAGAQAGVLASAGMQTQVQAGAGGVQYAGHSEAGSGPTAPGAAEWPVEWTAPARGAGPIQLHASANVADGDNSALGDHVYAVERAVLPR
jgi:hypothetical protein